MIFFTATVLWDDKGYPAIPAGIVARTDWPTFETLKLIGEAMLNFKDNLTHRNTHCQKKGYVALGKFMYERRLYYTARNMKGRIKGLVTTYESDSADPSWEYRELIAMYLGEKPFDASVLTDMLAKYKPTSAPKRRSLVEQNKIACGVWSCNSGKLQIRRASSPV
ncbi:uncharacterized protein LOC127751712 isoform X2 [Frankliniella occidentalis]|uniref:Uncharacterized protein LOC127751712 isoform X2 n=1 Tax=Frankliniella occidentalis TaxID=133901 RepID=A0A9C6X9G6_FRAOC|nr:uncharacterized protein LOC127751712 isoform X2 [Frankliniella occidentalis]